MIRIQRETDVVALAALALALLTGLAQLAAWTQGSRIVFLSPEKVALVGDTASNGQPIVRIVAPLAYANTAEQAYAGILLREKAKVAVGRVASSQEWNAFGRIVRGGAASEAVATPQTLSGQSALSHVTLFAPAPRSCAQGEQACDTIPDYVTPAALAHELRPGRSIRFEFSADFYGGKTRVAACEVPVTDQLVQHWAREPFLFARCRAAG